MMLSIIFAPVIPCDIYAFFICHLMLMRGKCVRFFSYVPHICTCSVLLERKSIKCMREAYGVITVVAAMI